MRLFEGTIGNVRTRRVAVVGAGIGGLAAALDLARRGVAVTVFERATRPGGKLRETIIDGARIDAGPTVFTMRHVFDQLFADAGATFADHVELEPAEVLARHAWSAGERLDLFADLERTVDAIAAFSGPQEARRYRGFCARAAAMHDTLDRTFMQAQRPSLPGLIARIGPANLSGLMRISPFATLWGTLGRHFRDPRLRQLFGRYATYCGSSPFLAAAPLMVVAHVERAGVWLVDGGMHRIAAATARLTVQKGATIRYGAEVAEIMLSGSRVDGVRLRSGERFEADAVIVNADHGALAAGLLGAAARKAAPDCPPAARSLSAVTVAAVARTEGFPLVRHTVFFCPDYRAEFDAIFRDGRLPDRPTVYVCAQDRGAAAIPIDRDVALSDPQRLLLIVNAPANGDRMRLDSSELAPWQDRIFTHLAAYGLRITATPRTLRVTTPADFEALFPATGGALYGPASHGWMASFRRPGARTRIPGLYLAGGSAHPGPGVPMAAISGRLAAESLISDFASMRRSHPVAMPGGMSTP